MIGPTIRQQKVQPWRKETCTGDHDEMGNTGCFGLKRSATVLAERLKGAAGCGFCQRRRFASIGGHTFGRGRRLCQRAAGCEGRFGGRQEIFGRTAVAFLDTGVGVQRADQALERGSVRKRGGHPLADRVLMRRVVGHGCANGENGGTRVIEHGINLLWVAGRRCTGIRD